MTDSALFKKKLIRSFLQMFSGTGIKTVASIFSGYFFALFLGPAVYGVWQTARVFLSYSTFLSLGIPFVMRRDFIFLRAEGKNKEAETLAQVSMTYSFIVNPLAAVLIICIALITATTTMFKISLVVVGLLYITQLITGIGNILHKGYNDYKTLAIGDIIYGAGLLLIIPIVYFKGYYALLVGYLTLSIIQSAYFFIMRPLPYKWNWNFPLLKKMIFTAFPIFLVTITSTVFASVDRLLIAGMLDFENVGLYSLSSFIAQPVTLLVSSFSIVLFTQLNERYGNSKEPHVISKHVHIPQRFFSNLLPPLMGVGIVCLPVLTQLLLPRYEGGVLAAQINIYAILFIKLAGFSSNALFVLNKQKFTALSFFIAGAIKIAGSYYLIKGGFGIVGVAASTLVAYFIYNALMLFFIQRSTGTSFYEFIMNLVSTAFPAMAIMVVSGLYLLFGDLIIGNLGMHGIWQQTFLGIFIVSIVGLPFLYNAYSMTKAFRLA
jgi:O-antigen/teichoic acid export membrane protein